MKKRDKYTQLKEEIKTLSLQPSITVVEKKLLHKYLLDLEKDVYFDKVVFQLKFELSPLALKGELSKEVVAFYTELSRRQPTASIFNFMIR